MDDVREIHSPRELQAFLGCSDESLVEICQKAVALADAELPWTTTMREEFSETTFDEPRDELRELRTALADYDAAAFVRPITEKEWDCLEYGELPFAVFQQITLFRYAYPHLDRFNDESRFSPDYVAPCMAVRLDLSEGCKDFHLSGEPLKKFRQFVENGRYDYMEDPTAIPPFQYDKEFNLRDLYGNSDSDDLDED